MGSCAERPFICSLITSAGIVARCKCAPSFRDFDMDFEFNTSDNLQISDSELSDLLMQVYVEGGFTDPEHARTVFDPSGVRRRGTLIGVREKKPAELAGIIILVPPESEACRLATDNEVEMQLLGVKSKYRNKGLGRQLVEKTISIAKNDGRSKMILWTQQTMKAAQKLYESFGFSHVKNIELGAKTFLVYCLEL